MMEYAPLDVVAVRDFAAAYLPDEPTSAEEFGDGNLNLVFRVRGGGRSVVVKQALPYMRLAGEGWPLTLDRARIEAEALALEGALAPGSVPRLIHYDPILFAIVMEDLAEYEVLRSGMIAQRDYPRAFEDLGMFAARTLLGSSDIVMAGAERKALARRFHNPELCAITEDLVFTSPFSVSASNRIPPELEGQASRLREDRAVRREAARLRFVFKTRAEAIVHGDLHTGSVMVTQDDTRVIDPEFAFPGPIAFDTGKMLGNLAMSFIAHRALGHHTFAAKVSRSAHQFWAAFVEEGRGVWPAREPWRDAFVADVLSDSARFAGAVMCRRTIGLAGVADVRGIEDAAARLDAQRRCIDGGVALMTSSRVGSMDDLWALATESCGPSTT
jgi:5-methylthioribose kinase